MTGMYAFLTSALAGARRLSISLGRYATVLQAEICAILVSACEIQLHGRPEKHVSIRSDSQAARKALQTARTSPLVQQCQKALNDISTWHAVGLYWGPAHTGYKEMKMPTSSQEMVLFKSLLDMSQLWESRGRI